MKDVKRNKFELLGELLKNVDEGGRFFLMRESNKYDIENLYYVGKTFIKDYLMRTVEEDFFEDGQSILWSVVSNGQHIYSPPLSDFSPSESESLGIPVLEPGEGPIECGVVGDLESPKIKKVQK